MKKQILTLLSILLLGSTIAQTRDLEISARRLDDNSVEINYIKHIPGTYSVVLNFNTLTNTDKPYRDVYTADRTSGTLEVLKPKDKNQGIGYGYSYQYVSGALSPRIKTDFNYTLPYITTDKIKVQEAYFANEKYFGATTPSDWKCYAFITNKPDTVIACRKGIVINVVDKYEDIYSKDIEYTSKKNQITIEHEDGTLMRYSDFKKGTISVKPGDNVITGTPLGISAQAGNNFYRVSLLLYYLSSIDFESLKNASLNKHKSLYKIITPKFIYNNNQTGSLAAGTDYTACINDDIVTKEMSKREIKKYKSSLQ